MPEISESQTLKSPEAPGLEGGAVTLVFTDVQGSTVLWEAEPEAMWLALAFHDALLRECIVAYRGYEVKTEGDAFMVAFASAADALGWCLSVQRGLMTVDWPAKLLMVDPARPGDGFHGLRVRIGLHRGHPIVQPNPLTGRMDYFGPGVNLAARITGEGVGGQIVCRPELLEEMDSDDFVQVSMSSRSLKGVEEPVELVAVTPSELSHRVFPDDPVPTRPGAQPLRRDLPRLLREAALGLAARADARRVRGAFGKALEDAELAANVARSLGRPEIVAQTLVHLAEVRRNMGDSRGCREALKEAEPLARGDRWLHARALSEIGNLAIRTGDGVGAEPAFRKALPLYQGLGFAIGIARVSNNLANSLALQGRYREAAPFYERSAEAHARSSNIDEGASARFNQALVAIELQDERAVDLLGLVERAVANRTTAKGLTLQVKVVGARATLALDRLEVDEAVTLARQSLAAMGERITPWTTEIARLQLATALALQGEVEEACALLEQATAALEVMGDTRFCWLGRATLEVLDPQAQRRDALAQVEASTADPTVRAAAALSRGVRPAAELLDTSASLRALVRLSSVHRSEAVDTDPLA